MLLPQNIHPANSLYFNGAFVLEALRSSGKTTLLNLYIEVRKLHEMPMPIFVLSLDWLFLAELVLCNSAGELEICS
jgi:predicted AAA+ superfamily ATPase